MTDIHNVCRCFLFEKSVDGLYGTCCNKSFFTQRKKKQTNSKCGNDFICWKPVFDVEDKRYYFANAGDPFYMEFSCDSFMFWKRKKEKVSGKLGSYLFYDVTSWRNGGV